MHNERSEEFDASSKSSNLFYHLSAFLKFYIDDGNLIADFDLMKQLIRYIIDSVIISIVKRGQIYFSLRKEILINEFGFDPNVKSQQMLLNAD